MEDPTHLYEVILTRHHISEGVRQNVSQLREIFAALDGLAGRVDGEDDVLMELVNTVADLFRGSLVKLFGVDIRPVSELGPFDDVDVEHTLVVLGRLLGVSAWPTGAPEPPATSANKAASNGDKVGETKWREANRQRLFDQILRLEAELNRYSETVKDQLPPEADAAFLGLQRHVHSLRSETDRLADGGVKRNSTGLV